MADNTALYELMGFVARAGDVMILQYDVFDALKGNTKKRHIVVSKFDNPSETYEEMLRNSAQEDYAKGAFRALRRVFSAKPAIRSYIARQMYDALIANIVIKDNAGQRWIVTNKGIDPNDVAAGEHIKMVHMNRASDDEIGDVDLSVEKVILRNDVSPWADFARL